MGARLGHRRAASRPPRTRSRRRSARGRSSRRRATRSSRRVEADVDVNHATRTSPRRSRRRPAGAAPTSSSSTSARRPGSARSRPPRQGGRITVCGATSGPNPPAALHRVWWKQLSIFGSTMGTKEDFEGAYELVAERPGEADRRRGLPARRGPRRPRAAWRPASSSARSCSRSPASPVLARLLDERLEQREVLALLRMPEHAEREPVRRVLERLDRPVLGPGRFAEPLAKPAEALVVRRLDRRAVAEDLAELRFALTVTS